MPESAANEASAPIAPDTAPRMPGRQKSPVRRNSREKLERIMEATALLLADRDFDAISVGDIARASGLNRTSIYNFFESTGEIFAALTRRAIRLCDQHADDAMPDHLPDDLFDRLDRITDIVVADLNQRPVESKCMFSGSKYDAYLVDDEYVDICTAFFRRHLRTCPQQIPDVAPDPLRTLSFLHMSFHSNSIRKYGHITAETADELKTVARGYLALILGRDG